MGRVVPTRRVGVATQARLGLSFRAGPGCERYGLCRTLGRSDRHNPFDQLKLGGCALI